MSKRWVVTSLFVGLLCGVEILCAQSTDNALPPAKQAIEDQYSDERLEGIRHPAVSDPDLPLPAVQPPKRRTGINEDCEPYQSVEIHTVNCWQGSVAGRAIVVYAGSRRETFDSDGNPIVEPNPQQGLVIVEGDETVDFYPTPQRTGALAIVAERNPTLILVSETGRSYAFDVSAGAFKELTSFSCPHGQGFWKNNPGAWTVRSLTLGNDVYSQQELLAILTTPVGSAKTADASLILGQQLVSAKLSIAHGSDPAPIRTVLQDADQQLIRFYNDQDKIPYKVKASSSIGQAMINDASTLDNYSSGKGTPGCGS